MDKTEAQQVKNAALITVGIVGFGGFVIAIIIGAANDSFLPIVGFVAVLVGLFCYFLPTVNAASRGHIDVGSIAVINVFFGWTVIGWFVALIWSCSGNTRSNREMVGGAQ